MEQEKAATLDLISISSTAEEEISATHADVAVSVSGSSFFVGNIALKKAREIAQLIADLEKVGVPEDQVDLRGVRADVHTGSLGGKTSSATYSLQIVNVPLALLSDVVGVITSQKNTTLGAISWRYGDTDAFLQKLLESALRKARAKAELVATSFGVQLLGVHTFKESTSDIESRQTATRDASDLLGASMSRARRVADDFSMGDVSHRKRVSVSIAVQYRVSSIVTNGV